jgi:hypothetical protein
MITLIVVTMVVLWLEIVVPWDVNAPSSIAIVVQGDNSAQSGVLQEF